MQHLLDSSFVVYDQQSPPTEIYIPAGRDRLVLLGRAGIGSTTVTPPTLGGEAADQSSGGGNVSIPLLLTCWSWGEAALNAAGLATNQGGTLAVANYGETGGQPTTERVWCSATFQGYAPTFEVGDSGFVGPAQTIEIPTADLPALSYTAPGKEHMLVLGAFTDTNAVVVDLRDLKVLHDPVTKASYKLHFWNAPASETVPRYAVTMDRDVFSNDEFHLWAKFQPLEGVGDYGPNLPVRRPQSRSIDAKTISDRYNMGVPEEYDYLFGARKFYQ